MQILYWHLTHPQSSACGGSRSPPLLQRRSSESSLTTRAVFPKTSRPFLFKRQSSEKPFTKIRETGDRTQSHPRNMEIENDDQMPTFYLLNAVDLPEDEDGALNHHLNLINSHHQNNHDNSYNGPLVGNGSAGDGGGGGGGGPPGGHYSSQIGKSVANKRKKRRSNDLARVLCIEDESDSDVESCVNIGPSKSKKAKLIVNLYPEEQGYSFGYHVPGSNECSESHPIPYSERYLLESIDQEQIPHKVLCKLEDKDGVYLMRYRNQVVAEIRDYRKSTSFPFDISSSTSSNNSHHQPSDNRNNNSTVMANGNLSSGSGGSDEKKPIVKQVMLRPTTESLLCDFDMLVEKAHQDRGGWNTVLGQSKVSGDVTHLLGDGSDSECEYEVDLNASERPTCNYLSYEQRLDLERKFVNKTAGPLCLDPSPEVNLIANGTQYEKYMWNTKELKSASKKWQENPFKSKRVLNTPDTSLNAPSLSEGRLYIDPFLNYVTNIRTKKEISSRPFGTVDKDFSRLHQISYQDYPEIECPKNMDEIQRIGQTPEPAQIRVFPNENFVRKIEEYILETERRKRPHTTTLSIFQRNGMESYFGELEMESFLDPNQPRIAAAPASTKCQFELGSSRNVTLYVKQFSDIFTEDGRRPCKITYQKVGQTPQVVYTNSYKSAPTTPQPQPPPSGAPQSNANATSSQPLPLQTNTNTTSVTASIPQTIVAVASTSITTAASPSSVAITVTSTSAGVSSTTHPVPSAVPSPSSTPSPAPPTPGGIVSVQQQSPSPQQVVQVQTTTSTAPSLPPVQIVHPQPRSNPQQVQQQQQQKSQQTVGQRQIQIFTQQSSQSQNAATSQTTSQAATNVNLNVNLAPQQVLTRPHIVNVSLQQQQQNAAAQQQLLQLTQQRILRMKQQQPNSALTKLLLSNIQQSKPITVAVQPTPQNPATSNGTTSNNSNSVCSTSSPQSSSVSCSPSITSSPVDQQQAQANPLGSPIMIQSPPSVSTAGTNPSNVNVNLNASPNVNVNLNTISLDGLLAASSANVNYANAGTLTTNQAGTNVVATSNVNLGLSRITTSSGQTALNFLRLNNTTGAVTATSSPGGNTVQLAAVQRQLAALNGNVSIVQQGRQQPQQRILINANSVNNLNLNSVGTTGEVDEMSVPDLTTLLGGQPIQISSLGQQQHILTNASTSTPNQTTIDTTNLNLNLNVNLNSGTVVNNGDAQVQQHQIAKIQGGEWATTAQAPPFLVFISPLRPMSIATPSQTASAATVTRQLMAPPPTVNNNSTLNVNLGAAVQQQQQSQIVQSQPGKVSEGPTRILLGTCNNGVAIKREVATPPNAIPSSVLSNVVSSGDNNSNNSVNSNQTQNLGESASSAVDSSNLLDSHHHVVGGSGEVVVDGVDSLFNALSEAIGPEQLQKLDAIHGNIPTSTGGAGSFVETIQTGMNSVPSSVGDVITSSNITASSISVVSNNTTTSKNNSANVITLSDLLGSPTVVSSSTGNAGSSFPSLILSSVGNNPGSSTILSSSPTLSSLLNSGTTALPGVSASPQTSSTTALVTQSSIVSSTPRLSALLAGTPSADTIVVGAGGHQGMQSSTVGVVDSSTGSVGGSGVTVSSASYGTLLDRLAASMNQPQGTTTTVRTGASRLNPIASATPNVILDHPVLAATLTQQQQQQQIPGSPTTGGGVARGASTFRQIAPAPSPLGASSTTTSIGSSNSSGTSVTVISPSDIQSHAIQSPQLINLLGLVGNNSGGAGQPRTIRISTSSPATNPSPGPTSH